MDIECQGCLFTVSSFVCLTEDLSNILQFLWRHGCLRKSYLCDRCGRNCAIGDKDLFFRCNRNIIEEVKVEGVGLESVIPSTSSQTGSKSNNVIQNSQDLEEYPVEISPYRSIYYQGEATTIHPALRQTTPLPGDPLPPTQPSLVYPNQTYMAEHHCAVRKGATGIPNSQADDLNSIAGSNLADLDAEATSRKRAKDSSTQSIMSRKRCNFKVSMRKGTIFEKSKLPIDTVCKFFVFWCCLKQPTQEFLCTELSLASRTVVDWSTTCREICIQWAQQHSEKIGGIGVVVQVDEVKVVANNNGTPGHGFSFWGLEKDKNKGKIFVVPVPFCDAWSLLNVIVTWVHPGSVIVSNCWKSYDCLKIQEFVQHAASHSKTFLNPPSNSTNFDVDQPADATNRKKTEDMQMPRFGTRRSHHLGDLAEFMFKRRHCNHLERMHAFFKQIAIAYPLHT